MCYLYITENKSLFFLVTYVKQNNTCRLLLVYAKTLQNHMVYETLETKYDLVKNAIISNIKRNISLLDGPF